MARLYPAAWRERYAAEFDALIDDMRPQWHDLFNVPLGALRMQMGTRNYLKIAAFAGLAGALVAGVCALTIEDRYMSTAVVRFTFAGLADGNRQGTLDRLARMKREVLSRNSLAEMMAQPALDLYAEDRKRMALEDVVENMRRGLRINLLEGGNWRATTFETSCMYPDKFKARAVVADRGGPRDGPRGGVTGPRRQQPASDRGFFVARGFSSSRWTTSRSRPMFECSDQTLLELG